MKQHPGAGRRNRSAAPGTGAAPDPVLPAWKAFVVQFSREAGKGPGSFAGRVEHLNSGRRARFGSPAELVSILESLLHEVGSDE
jgi:hypothetical protein